MRATIIKANNEDAGDKEVKVRFSCEMVEVMKRVHVKESFLGKGCPMIAALKSVGIEVEQ